MFPHQSISPYDIQKYAVYVAKPFPIRYQISKLINIYLDFYKIWRSLVPPWTVKHDYCNIQLAIVANYAIDNDKSNVLRTGGW